LNPLYKDLTVDDILKDWAGSSNQIPLYWSYEK
jgi:hypothetical protein